MTVPLAIDPVSPRRRERAKAANREAILAAGRQVFAELGYDAATVRDIIRRTDLAAGTFYNYFKSKEEVFQALAEDGARRFRPMLRAAREQATTFEAYLRHAVTAYLHFRSADHADLGLNGPPLRARASTPEMAALFEEVRDGIEDVMARGFAPPVDAEYLACACIGMAQEVADCMLMRQPHDLQGAADFICDLVLGGLARAGSKADRP
jgi:AcrR family transcriptional regulator